MKQKFDSLSVVVLDQSGHLKTCNYWYLVQCHHGPCTAFTKRESLLNWMVERGLQLTEPLGEHGKHSWQKLNGHYFDQSHYGSVAEFDAMPSGTYLAARKMDNGEYTEAKIVRDDAGVATVHYLNCNEERHVFDYNESRALVG
jgi:hypothetical protein